MKPSQTSSRGKGRGDLVKQILGEGSSSSGSGSGSVSGSSKSKQDSGAQDSGVGHSQSGFSITTLKTTEYQPGSSTSTSSGSSHSKPSTSSGSGSGRGKLLQSLQISSAGKDEVLKTVSAPSKGRGKILQAIGIKDARSVSSEEVESITHEVKKLEIKKHEVSEHSPEGKVGEPVIRKGSSGQQVDSAVNYLRLYSDKNKGVFEYEVCFSPSVDSKIQRMKYLNEHKMKYGGVKSFDGTNLYLPILLEDKITILYSNSLTDNKLIEIKLIYKRKKPLGECIQLYNILFNRIMKTLNYVQFDRKLYDPTSPKIIPQHKLEVWPGYVTAVDEYEDGIMLCCDVSHRVLCQTTVLDKMKEIYRNNPQDFQEQCKKTLLGSVVLTRYNNKIYRIDDINFQDNPTSKFKLSDGSEISYIKYYNDHYNITITDTKQPLLISIKQRRVAGKEVPEEIVFCILPEISYLSGLRDDMRSDYKVMKDLATFTKVTPNQRINALEKFYRNINNCKEAREILAEWGLQLAENPVKLISRQLPEETIYFAQTQVTAGVKASFASQATNNKLLEVININNWLLIHTKNSSKSAKSFLEYVQKVANPMGMWIKKPNVLVLNDDRTSSFVNALRANIKTDTQIVVIICPTSRDDSYSAIKRICCAEIPVPSQVINAKTLYNEAKNRSIVQKIVLQMNCKLGGTLWSVNIPMKNLMICGIDSYHDAGHNGNSVGAFVASLNQNFTKWYSRAVIQTKKEEIIGGLCVSLTHALQEYKKVNNSLPDKIIIYRDGVGDGQLKVCSEYEIPQFLNACRIHNPEYKPKLTFVVVQKRINTRIFAENRDGYVNPNPGFVLDHTVTRRYMYDFFLISQSVREGTVSPSHYIVLNDDGDLKPDIIQRMSYKLCFMYYNWPGTVRVPACCQYAHKLAYLVGQNIKRQTSDKLADKLFYL